MTKRRFLLYKCYKSKHDTSTCYRNAVHKKVKNLQDKFMIDESRTNNFLNSENHDLDNCIICKYMNDMQYQKYIYKTISKVASLKQTN